MTLLMILVLPFVWSVPMAFVSSELGSMVPEAGGLYRWIRRGMGEYWSFQAGWWWTLSLYVDSAVYVALALDYMQSQVGLRRRRAARSSASPSWRCSRSSTSAAWSSPGGR